MTYDIVLVEESPSAETEKFTRIQPQLLLSFKVSTEQLKTFLSKKTD